MKIYCSKCRNVFEAEKPAEGTQVNCTKCGEPVDFPESPTAPGAVIGDFLIEKPLSKGGMGEVFLARQLSLDRPVALKVLQNKFVNDKEYVDSLIHEARAAGRINHPNIVQAYAVGEENGIYYFAMEFVRGETFKQILKREKKLDFLKAAKVIREIASALDAAWREQKLVHQDIKPDNIMLDANGFAKLADLGLARVAGNEPNDAEVGDEVMGTPQYISPEQLTGVPTDVRSDIYSLGATFYQFVTGRFPYSADTALEIAKMHVAGNLTPPKQINPELPDELNTIIMKMMARDREQRYQTPGPLIKALDLFISSYRPSTVPKMNLNFGRKPAPPVFKLPKAGAPVPAFKLPGNTSPAPGSSPATEVTEEKKNPQVTLVEEVKEEQPENDVNVTVEMTDAARPPEPTIPPNEAVSDAVETATPEPKPAPVPQLIPEPEPVPVPEPEMPRPEFAPEPETVEPPPPEVSRFRKILRRSAIPLAIVAGVFLLLAILFCVTLWLANAGHLPEPLKPFGNKLLACFSPDEKSEPAAPPATSEPVTRPESQPESRPEPPKKEPEKPAEPETRPAYLNGVEEILAHVRNNPSDREGLLKRGDAFFAAYPQPLTEEERSVVTPLLQVYGRVDELFRAAPARQAAREKHLAEIAAREQADESAAEARRRAEEEEKARRAAAEQAAREQAEQQRREAEIRKQQVAERTRQLQSLLDERMRQVAATYLKNVAAGNLDALKSACATATAAELPAGCDTPEEKKLIERSRKFFTALPAEAAKVENFRKLLESISARNGFNVETTGNQLVEIVAVRPGSVVRLTDNGEAELNLSDSANAELRTRFYLRLDRKLKQSNTEFFHRLLSGDLPSDLAKRAPKGFWSDYYKVFQDAAAEK